MSSINELPSVIPEFSVVIPAFNEAAHIAKSLSALEAQTLPSSRFEVIVVDNGSSDATIEIANRFKSRLRLQVLSRPKCHVSAVRNFGASAAQGRILAFLDADCIPPADWLEQSVAVASPETIWGAHYLVPEDSTWVGKVWFEYQATEQEGAVSFVPAGDLFIFYDQFEAIGGFSEDLETSEDVEICLRAQRHGMQVVAWPRVAVLHEGTPKTLRHFYRQNRWHGTHVARSFFSNLPSMRNLPLVAMSFYTLLMFWLALITAVMFVWRHYDWLPAFFVLLLLIPSLLRALWKTAPERRLQSAPSLFVLYLTYSLARAASLTRLAGRTHR